MTTAIIDYGMGNVRSLSNALEYVGNDVVLTKDPGALADADRLLLPGVGAFGDAMAAINASGLRPLLDRLALEERKPVLGVCLGMQLFAKRSLEHGVHEGLGWLDAEVLPMRPTPPSKVPHVGWNAITPMPAHDWLFDGLPAGESDFYFVHSFHMVCHDSVDCAATCEHGGTFTAAVARGNLVATQFHPEKSQDNGLQLLTNWLNREF
ncbi:MAG: imidazole glycerol phosphate synthase subunit HisH [Sphingomonas sp.]|uniref:imidazole glycerol phosphate synthase subunit HisH n=1 Tax=Sphingomonas sp. TaxID=28214 RepID=UPI0025F62616|nr:imidazole glycerol phosphate synthase subunit HisH [Sphingomonas sp.]MBX9881066.1 imidazole glycerol phosphate synthase subunit HisH [Sphingomonas sp.]